MNDWRMNLASNLKYLRQEHHLTQQQMADIICVSISTYRKMEKADPIVRIHSGRICRLCDYFRISSDSLLQQNWQKDLS